MEKLVKRRKIHKGHLISLIEDTVSIGDRHAIREIVVHPGSAVIIPLLSKPKKEIVLIRQYRYAVDSYLFELPAGTIETGESPLACAKREIIEETGYRAGKIKKLLDFHPSPGILTEQMHLFLATNLKKTEQNTDFDENIKPAAVTLDTAVKMIRGNKIKDAKTIAGIFLLREIL